MSTSSGESGFCNYCGHPMDGHTKASHSKCKRCKKRIYVCQAGQHDEGGGWRICYVPCGCGQKNYPSTARAARPLEPTEYASTHPQYESPNDTDTTHTDVPGPASPDVPEPTYVELLRSGDYLGFYDYNEDVIWTSQSDWRSSTIWFEGAEVACFQFESAGYSYFTWRLDVDSGQEGTEQGQSQRSLGKKAVRQPSTSHGRTLSEESIDPLQWDQERITAETMASAMRGLTVGEGSSQQGEGHGQVSGTVPVSARLSRKGMVDFTVKSSGKKLASTREKWVSVKGGYVFESQSEGCIFFAKEIKPAKKK